MEIVLGVLVSGIVQFIKKRLELENTTEIIFMAVIISLIASIGYLILSQNEAWLQVIIQTLTTAGAFYAFILKHIDNHIESNAKKVKQVIDNAQEEEF